MDYLSKLRERLGQAPKKPKNQNRSVIQHNRFDKEDWLDIARPNPAIDAGITELFVGETKEDGRPGYDNAPELVQDLFYAFLKPQPRMERPVNVAKDARLNGKLIRQMMKLTEYQRLHDQTMTDPVLATLATEAVMEALKEMVEQEREATEKSNEEKRKQTGCTPGQPSNTENGQPGDTDGGSGGGGKSGQEGSSGGDSQGKWNQEEGEDQSEGQSDEDGPDQGGDESKEPETPEDEWDAQDNPPKDGQGQQGDGDPEDGDGQGSGLLDDQDREFDWDNLGELPDATDLDEMLDMSDMVREINSSLRDLADELEELDTFRRSVGLDPAEWQQTDPSRRIEIANLLKSEKMRKLADIVGRMKRYAMSQQQTKIIEAPHEIYDVEMGNDLRKTLRSEFALLGTEETKLEFYRRYANRELLQFKTRGHEDVGKGPIVCAIDNSGSMGGEPENWAKATAEALRRICSDQDRDFFAMYFETNYHRERFEFPKGKADIDTILKFLSITAGGGTEFDGVLTEALQRCEEQFSQGKGKADIVFITDGEAYLDERWLEEFVAKKKEMGVRIFSVYISGAYDSYRAPVELLNKFSDVVISVKDLTTDAVKDIFANV